MDDVTLGGPADVVVSDVAIIKTEEVPCWLHHDDNKSESIIVNG